MDKIEKFDWECWDHYGIEGKFRKIGNKIDELIGGYEELKYRYNEMMINYECLWKELRKIEKGLLKQTTQEEERREG